MAPLLPQNVWLAIAELLIKEDKSNEAAASTVASPASLMDTTTPQPLDVMTAAMMLDAKSKSYVLYYACVAGDLAALRAALDAGADPDTRWFVACNHSAEELIADNERIGGGTMMALIDSDEEDEDEDVRMAGEARFWAIPEFDLAEVLPQRRLCRTTGALGRMLYGREEARLEREVPNVAQREELRDAHLMRDRHVDDPVTTGVWAMVSALHTAATLGHADVVEELLQRGTSVNLPMRATGPSASVEKEDKDWRDDVVTAVDCAAGASHTNLAQVLLAKGCATWESLSKSPQAQTSSPLDGRWP